jgi:hypothetical protein
MRGARTTTTMVAAILPAWVIRLVLVSGSATGCRSATGCVRVLDYGLALGCRLDMVCVKEAGTNQQMVLDTHTAYYQTYILVARGRLRLVTALGTSHLLALATYTLGSCEGRKARANNLGEVTVAASRLLFHLVVAKNRTRVFLAQQASVPTTQRVQARPRIRQRR